MARPRKHTIREDDENYVKPADPNDPEFFNEFYTDWMNSWSPHAAQKAIIDDFISDKYNYQFNRAGRKFSKTTIHIKASWYTAIKKPNSIIYATFPTIALGLEILWDEKRLQYCDMQEDFMFRKYIQRIDSTKNMLYFVNGSSIKVLGTWTESRGRGTQPDFITIDEVQDCNAAWIEAMDSNLSAKNGSCMMSGTPPKKRNHYQDWEERIRSNPKGKCYHYSSYANDKIPHLKEWLDAKKLELIKVGKEDVWLREYMAEDCFSHADRVLPDAQFEDYVMLEAQVNAMPFKEKTPFMVVATQGKFICAVWGIITPKKYFYILDYELNNSIWDQSYVTFFERESVKMKSRRIQEMCGNRMRQLVWDSTRSFKDVIRGFTDCKEKPEWQDRGIPLLKEMMLERRSIFSDKVAPFGMECQNILADEPKKDIEKQYPMICALSVMAHEWFQRDKVTIKNIEQYDHYQAFRDAGLILPKRQNRKSFYRQSSR